MAPIWLWAIFALALGSCVGSFLNVVIWRVPRGGSILRPANSYCPHCNKPIAWFDNIPILSWLALRAKCRQCGGPISGRYPLVELLGGLLFVALLLGVYAGPFRVRAGVGCWPANWPGYVAAAALMSGLLAASMIDLEHFFIPLPVVWFGGLVAVALSAAAPGPWLPTAGPAASAWAVGGTLGLLASMALLWAGIIPLSFPEAAAEPEKPAPPRPAAKDSKRGSSKRSAKERPAPAEERAIGVTKGARREVCKELLFLAPVVLGGWTWRHLTAGGGPLERAWSAWCHNPHVAGLCGSLFGLLIGGAIIWFVRIIGTLIAGREAMGLGDVHVLAAAGALLGWGGATLAFFISPFYGLAIGLVQWVRRGRRELPFGPYLSLAVLTVLLFYDRLADWLGPPLRAIYP